MKKNIILVSYLTISTLLGYSQEANNEQKKDTTEKPKQEGVNTVKPQNPTASNNQGGNNTTEGKDVQSQFNALINYNFAGNNKGLSNLTPIIHLGTEIPLVEISDKASWSADFDPYIGAQISTKDSVSLIPALMLYGNGGLVINNYLKFKIGEKNELTLAPLNFGVKFLNDFLDSGNLIIQHNLRFGMAFRQDDNFMIGIQFTQGWHNLSSESERFYKKVFSNENSSISYVTVTLQIKLSAKALDKEGEDDPQKRWFAYFEWRSLLNREDYTAFTNNRIFTIGLRRDIGLRNAFFAKGRTRQN